MRLRGATPDDAAAVAGLVARGFDSYRAFTGPGWAPPQQPIGTVDDIRARLERDDVWGMVAEEAGSEPHGVVCFKQMVSERSQGHPLPGLAHFWLLFVDSGWQGRGVGRALHDMAVAEMKVRGFERAQLWTPTRANAARALYESGGWQATGSFHADALGLDLTVYELDLRG